MRPRLRGASVCLWGACPGPSCLPGLPPGPQHHGAWFPGSRCPSRWRRAVSSLRPPSHHWANCLVPALSVREKDLWGHTTLFGDFHLPFVYTACTPPPCPIHQLPRGHIYNLSRSLCYLCCLFASFEQNTGRGGGEDAQPGLLWRLKSPRRFGDAPPSPSWFFAAEIWLRGAEEMGPSLFSRKN